MSKKVLLYARVSTEEQGTQYSLPHQKERLFQYCEMKGYEVVAYFQEKHSAKNFEDREKFQELSEYAKKHSHDIDYLLVARWDRFSRNLSQSLEQIEYFKSLGIEVNAIEGEIDYKTHDFLIMQSLYLAIPEVENRRRAANTINGIRSANKAGRWCNMAPMGYRNVRDANNKPIVVPDDTPTHSGFTKAELVRNMWKDFATGNYGLQEIRLIYCRRGLKMQKSRIGNLLRSHFYYGKIEVAPYQNDAGGIYQGIHEPLISEEVFWQVQNILEGRKSKRYRIQSTVHPDLPLRGMVICGECGHKMTGSGSRSRNGDRHYYYHCESRTGCKQRIRADKLEELLYEQLRTIRPKKSVLLLYIEVLNDISTNGQRIRASKKIEVKEEIAKLKTKLEGLEEKYLFDDLDKDVYTKWKAKIEAEIIELKNSVEDVITVSPEMTQNITSTMPLLTNIHSYFERGTPTFKKNLLGSIITDGITVKDKNLDRTGFHEIIVELSQWEKKKPDYSGFSPMVAGTGLEPATFGL